MNDLDDIPIVRNDDDDEELPSTESGGMGTFIFCIGYSIWFMGLAAICIPLAVVGAIVALYGLIRGDAE